MRNFVLLLLTAWLGLVGCERAGDHRTSTGPITDVPVDDAEMLAAMQVARDTFPDFWSDESVNSSRAATSGQAMVKGYFPGPKDTDGGEHMWIDQVSYDGILISGVLASEPLELEVPKLGDRVEIPLERLSDWLIVQNGFARGAYTIQLLRKRMTDEERAQHDSRYPFLFRGIE